MKTSDKAGLATRVRSTRKASKITQVTLAKLAGCSQTAIVHIESGGSFSSRLLRDVATALNVSERWLLTGKGERTPPKEIPAGVPTRILLEDRVHHRASFKEAAGEVVFVFTPEEILNNMQWIVSQLRSSDETARPLLLLNLQDQIAELRSNIIKAKKKAG